VPGLPRNGAGTWCGMDRREQLVRRVLKVAGLPADATKLAALAPRANARLAAALVRVALDDDLRRQVTG
jgi:hypothetical protein